MQKGNKRGPAYAYNVKALRAQEMAIAEQAERAYEHPVEPVAAEACAAAHESGIGGRIAVISGAPRQTR